MSRSTTPSANTALHLSSLQVMVSLGWTEEERSIMQPVDIDISLSFPESPRGCYTDVLSDTYCYHSLTQKIKALCASQSFKLLEHLSFKIHRLIEETLTDETQISVTTTKFSPIEGLKEASFTYAT